MPRTRFETDSIGSVTIPESADYGVHTARAVENFPITGVTLKDFPELVQSLAMVKKLAPWPIWNWALSISVVGGAITRACDRIIDGEGHENFIVDMVQGGAGTSTNMNANEVVATSPCVSCSARRVTTRRSTPTTTSTSRNPPMTCTRRLYGSP